MGTVTTSGPFGSSGTLTVSNDKGEHEQVTVEVIRMVKDTSELIDYIASVDPKFKEYVMAYKAKKRILR